MTKAQAIKRLKYLGWTGIEPDGKFCVWAVSPEGQRGLFDPRDLVKEIEQRTQRGSAA